MNIIISNSSSEPIYEQIKKAIKQAIYTNELKEEEILKWLNNGAQPSDTVRNLLSKQGIMKKFADSKQGK